MTTGTEWQSISAAVSKTPEIGCSLSGLNATQWQISFHRVSSPPSWANKGHVKNSFLQQLKTVKNRRGETKRKPFS